MSHFATGGEQEQWMDISDWLAWWLAEPRLSPGAQAVFDRYYSSYKHNFTPYLRRHYASQTLEAQSLIGKRTRVLEVGCGCGTESLWFAILGALVVGVDLNEPRLKVARERASLLRETLGVLPIEARFENASLFDFKHEEEFDLIWMEQAFHHIEPRDKVPLAIGRLLRAGGHLVISEASGWNPLIQLSLLRKRGFRTIREYVDSLGNSHLYGVERVTTATQIVRLFERQGFKALSCRYFRVFPNIPLAERLGCLEKYVPAWALPLFTHYNVVLQKG